MPPFLLLYGFVLYFLHLFYECTLSCCFLPSFYPLFNGRKTKLWVKREDLNLADVPSRLCLTQVRAEHRLVH